MANVRICVTKFTQIFLTSLPFRSVEIKKVSCLFHFSYL
uniref:Uncharacterized protein n=1 Tax=Klebsiella pneumoniae TaxID=573 RepID=A0A8B0SSJ7_KLEPN|nr:hypothetical protein [Klebsiella pneumoniae]